MGCTQSKIDNEEIVSRCKERKLFMARAVTARNKFAAAHSATAMSLKNTGAALSDFAQGEVVFTEGGVNPISNPPSIVAGAIPPPPMPPYDSFLPPPPLPSFPTTPLQRAKTMPDDFKMPRPDDVVKPSGEPIIEEDEGEDDSESVHSLKRRSFSSKISGGAGGSMKGMPGMNSSVHIGSDDDHDGVEEVEDSVLHRRIGIRSSNNNQGHETKPPPSMPESKGMSSWDYFFSMENMPGPTLADVEESQAEREEIAKKVLDDSRRDMEEKATRSIGEKVTAQEDEVEVENVVTEELLPQPPPPQVAMAKVGKRGKQGVTVAEDANMKKDGGDVGGGGGVSLVQIFVELDDCFLKASESAHDVSRMLEATRLHYHSNFADKRGNINHSERVMRVITWNRSFRGLAYPDNGADDSDSEEHDTHAAVLDKMLAWEKKLYDEVKAGEQMKLEYQKKVASLNKLKKRNTNTEALERMKASVSHLHTRYIVDMQSMDSTVSEINRLRDDQLYPKLVALVDGMAMMWETMKIHHESKSKIVQSLRSLDISQSPKETTDHHHERTCQLGGVVQEWHANFTELMAQQKEYVKSLNGWLKLNLVPIDTNLKEKVSSPTRPTNPPVQTLLNAWYDHLEKIPDEPAKASINNFGAIVRTIWQYQEEELEFRNRCADSRKDLIRKTRDFENWYNKYVQRRTGPGLGPDEADPDSAHDKDVIAEKQLVVEAAKQKLEEVEDAYQRQCVQVREKSLMSLKSHLPDLFQALSVFSHACSDMYRNLRAIAHSRSRNP